MDKNNVFESDSKTTRLLNHYGQCDNNAISSTGRSDGDNFGTFSLFAGFDDVNVIEEIKDLTVSSPDGTGIGKGKGFFPMNSFPHTSYPGMIRLSESRRHSCGHCNKVFQSYQQLQQHNLVHSGERKYRCLYCDRAFKQLSHLQQHHRIHTGEKPYRCPLDGCDSAFPQLSNLQHHLRKHDKMVTSGHLCCICGSSYPSETVLRTHVLKIHNAETVSSHATVSESTQSELLRHIPTRSAPTTYSLPITPQHLQVITHNQSAANCPERYSISPPKYPKPHRNFQDPSLFGLNAVETPAQKTEMHVQERKRPKSETMLEECNIIKATCFDHIRQANKSHGKMEINRKLKRPLQVRPTGRVGLDIYSFNKSNLNDTGDVYCLPSRNVASIRDKLNIQITESCANYSFSRHEKLISKSNDSIYHILDGEINQEFASSIKTDIHTDLEYHNSNQHRATVTKLDNNLVLDASISCEENTVICQNINNDFRKDNQADRMNHIAMQEQEQIMCNRTCSVGVGGTSRPRKRKLTNPKRIWQRDLSTSQSLLSEVASFPIDNDLDLDVADESE